MNARTLLAFACLLLCAVAGRAASDEPILVFMPDGQMKSHLLRVYITKDITEAETPTLKLLVSRLLVKDVPEWAERPIRVRELARFQQWTEMVDGHEVSRNGTLLIFDLRNVDFPWFKACMRVTPVIHWKEQTAIGERPVYIGNLKVAMLWTGAMILVPLIMIGVFLRLSRVGNWKRLLSRPDGRMSLSKTQVAIWTICIGAMVFCFGITRLEPPAIPMSLVALMGLSLTTRALTYRKEKKQDLILKEPEWRHLIDGSKDKDKPVPAITRAQMLFWTIVVVCIFCVKSLLDGGLWDVPWQLVALMGMSQASYIVPIHVKQKPDDEGDSKQNPDASPPGSEVTQKPPTVPPKN